MTKKIIFALAVILSVSACEYKFAVTSPVDGNRMMVEWIVGLDDIDYVKIRKAVPVGAVAQDGNSYVLESMRFTENEVAVDLFKDPEEEYYYSIYTPEGGSQLAFSLSTQDEPSIKAYTTVPQKVETQYSYTLSDDEVHWELKISNVKDRNFALMAYYEEEWSTPEGEVRESWYNITISAELSGNTYYDFFDSGFRNLTYTTKPDNNYKLTLLRGVEIPDGKVSFKTTYSSESKYKLVLLCLSDEAYGFFNSKFNQDNNILATLGLSPANYAYTNVEGGYGVFGAVNRVEDIIEIK